MPPKRRKMHTEHMWQELLAKVGTGVCTAVDAYDGKSDLAKVELGAYSDSARLRTRPDFGCVLFEKRDGDA